MSVWACQAGRNAHTWQTVFVKDVGLDTALPGLNPPLALSQLCGLRQVTWPLLSCLQNEGDASFFRGLNKLVYAEHLE